MSRPGLRSCLVALVVAALSAACGRKGPPLPPLVRIPAAPAEFAAERRGSQVDIQFTVPATNTDGSRPANIQRVEVYAIDGRVPDAEVELMKQAKRVATLDVKSPRDPNAEEDPDQAPEDAEPLEGKGLDQGARARVEDRVTASSGPGGSDGDAPTRTYIGVGINNRGRRGQLSRRAAVPTGVPPPAPAGPVVDYTENAIRIGWPDHPAGSASAVFVYDVSPDVKVPLRITDTPLREASFTDSRKPRIEWGAERCYAISSVELLAGGLRLESELSPRTCRTLADTFPPAVPDGVQGVPGDHLVSLIWNANAEADLAGYLVFRRPAAGGEMTGLTPMPLTEAHFEDSTADPGQAFEYAVQAVDKAGNRSAMSAAVAATAR